MGSEWNWIFGYQNVVSRLSIKVIPFASSLPLLTLLGEQHYHNLAQIFGNKHNLAAYSQRDKIKETECAKDGITLIPGKLFRRQQINAIQFHIGGMVHLKALPLSSRNVRSNESEKERGRTKTKPIYR